MPQFLNIVVCLVILLRSSKSQICDEKLQYRSLDGLCNNLKNPYWGSAPRTHGAMVRLDYSDGKICDREAKPGTKVLPLSREISYNIMFKPTKADDPNNLTSLHYFFGMFLTHDITLSSPTLVEEVKYPCALTTPQCLRTELYVGNNDPRFNNTTCLPFVLTEGMYCDRTNKKLCSCTNCPDGQFQHMNFMTPYIDLSNVYSISKQRIADLTVPNSANFRMSKYNLIPIASEINSSAAPCLQADGKTIGPCLDIADKLGNIAEYMQGMYTLFLREHNLLVNSLRDYYPDEEMLFQEARKINIAMMQHITYNEYLPTIFGESCNQDLKVPTFDCFKYDSTIDVTSTIEFVSSAFRFGHTQPRNFVSLGNRKNAVSIANFFSLFTYLTSGPDVFDKMMLGILEDTAWESDLYYNEEFVNQVTIGNISQKTDMGSTDLERGRQDGVVSYTEMRRHLKLWVPETYDDLAVLMPLEIVEKIKKYYGENGLHNIDMILGTLAEYKETNYPGILFGQTNRLIIEDQFRRLKYGDRFWYEDSFSKEQLREIQKTTISGLICRHTNLEKIYESGFKASSQKKYCVDIMEKTKLDLNPWKKDTNCQSSDSWFSKFICEMKSNF